MRSICTRLIPRLFSLAVAVLGAMAVLPLGDPWSV